MTGARITARVAAGIARAGRKTGIGSVYELTVERPGTIDTSKYPPVTGLPSTFTVRGFRDSYSQLERANTLIEEGDVKFYIDPTSPEVTMGDVLVENGRRFAVMSVSNLAPAGVILLQEVRGRPQ